MSRSDARLLMLLFTLLASWPSIALAQVVGTFPWQMQPYCNVVRLTLTQTPVGFTLDGTDDQCGAATKASTLGVAAVNADGSVGLNFTIVTAPGAQGVHVAARVSPANGQGTWTDSVGNSGTFAFFGNTPGLPRPLPASGIGAGAITTVELAAGAVGRTDINPAEVQVRVAGACAVAQYLRGINADGTVLCEPLSSGADHAGAVKTVTFTMANVPAFGTASLTTLTFTAPISGVAILESRGHCETFERPVAVEIVVAAGPDAGSAFDVSLNPRARWGVMQIEPGTDNLRQPAWTTRNELPVVAGTPYTQSLFGLLVGTAPTTCSGTFSVTFHSAALP